MNKRKLTIASVFLVALVAAIPFCVKRASATHTDLDVKTVSALGNNSTTNYTIGFAFKDNDEVEVYRQDEGVTPYTRTKLAYGAGAGKYTITGGDPGTTVVMGTAPSTSQRVVLLRNTAKTQAADYVETEAFPAEDHEEQMDRQVQMIQEIDYATSQKIGLSVASPYSPPTFPDPQANRFILYNSGASDLTLAPYPSAPTQGDILKFHSTYGWSTYAFDTTLSALQADINSRAYQTALDAHTTNVSNPHNVTAAQVGNTTAQWNANKIQSTTVDASAIGNNKFLMYNSGTGNLEYSTGAALPTLGTDYQVLRVNSGATNSEWALLDNNSIALAAGISDTKLGTISTAGKVSNSATTAASANTASAIVTRDGSGNFTAGTITANVFLSGLSTLTDSLSAKVGGTGLSSFTRGDILYASGSSTLSKLGIGATGLVLGSSSNGLPEWTSSPTLTIAYGTQATPYSMVAGDGALNLTGSSTLTLLSAATATIRPYYVKNSGSSTIYLIPANNSGQGIDGETQQILAPGGGVTLIPNGSNWFIF